MMIQSKHINEMSPDLLRRAAVKQRRQLKDNDYLKSITAYDYLKKLRRIDDFMDYADEIVDRINAGQTVDRAAVVYYSQVDSATTKALAGQAESLAGQLPEGWNGLTCADPDGTRYLVIANLAGGSRNRATLTGFAVEGLGAPVLPAFLRAALKQARYSSFVLKWSGWSYSQFVTTSVVA